MIPAQNIVAWGNVVPWSDQRQVEQDLIIGRALVEIFSDDMLYAAVRVRGGTALNKLHFPKPMRYSEDSTWSGLPAGRSVPSSITCVSFWNRGWGERGSIRVLSHRSFASGSVPKTAVACRSG